MMKNNLYQSIKTGITLVLLVFSSLLFAQDGTKGLSPDDQHLSCLYMSKSLNYGSFFDAPDDNRIKFVLKPGEVLYFGFSWTLYSNGSTQTLGNASGMQYRILKESGTIVVNPTSLNYPITGANTSPAGFIKSFNEAVTGPNVLSGKSAGYKPLSFAPTVNDANGEVFIMELTTNSGGTAGVMSPYFDFTVAGSNASTAATYPGRVYATQWGINATIQGVSITSLPNFQTTESSAASSTYYGYTPSKNVLKVTLPDIRPYVYTLGVNDYGVKDTNNYPVDRKSVNNTISPSSKAPPLPGGYRIFLSQPDKNLFPDSGTGNLLPGSFNSPAVSSVNQCGTAPYYINFHANSSGDYQIKISAPGYTERVIDLPNTAVGDYQIIWDGKDGAGVQIPASQKVTLTLVAYDERFNIPLFDAEFNPGGIRVETIFPNPATVSNLFWDDTGLTATGCSGTDGNNNTGKPPYAQDNSKNGTPITQIVQNGTYSYPHYWNVMFDSPCSGYGNSRVINTWGYLSNKSVSQTASLSCGGDLTITKTVNNANPKVGDQITFTIIAKNLSSTGTAENVKINDVLPVGFTYVSATATRGTWSAPIWTIGNLNGGASETLTIVAKVEAETHYTNIAKISTDSYETNYNNNIGYAQIATIMDDITVTTPCTPGSTGPSAYNLNDVHIGKVPAGTSLVWFDNANHTGTALSNTSVTTSGTYYAFYYDAAKTCYSPASAKVNVIVQQCNCTKPPATGTPDGYTKVGISTYSVQTVDKDGKRWPENIANGFIALESNTKGFVITRTTSDKINSPRKGMLIYDTGSKCFKLYNGTTWHCITKSCNN